MSESEIAKAIEDAFFGDDRQEIEEDGVIDALYAIARGLDRIGAALDGPWPKALVDALQGRRE